MKTHIIDVAINVYGKPAQTALALVSLLAHSGRFIDRIYFNEEPDGLNAVFAHDKLLAALGDRVVCHRPSFMNWRYAVDEARLGDPAYRHALRYQYAFEHSDKRYLLIIHNDCEFTGDVVGLLLGALGAHSGAGEIGQCWLCPAAMLGRCGPGRYRDYRPDFAELAALYDAIDPAVYRRMYLQEPTDALRNRPWPLPECRLNEFCCLLRLDRVRPDTCPQGSARPFGAYVDVGNPYTGNGILDIGVAWFGDMVHLGHSFVQVPLASCVRHEGGHKSLFAPDDYVKREEQAIAVLRDKYGAS
ncbi:hypothetical protein [Solidesulfovibrio carbinolicus]|uniref:Uncharacterized protein n=1 Tax=Solidesulfovibrio carbinolicus TaxID=296842 RepID=A0A4P6I1A3_9BACT|nr:hypothetical protein [Solidesulfovibrio carbinolicus]QAZ67549.1 hypothetical protein C3Y92_10050 [Solidesulfovibrio carbinolicus]